MQISILNKYGIIKNTYLVSVSGTEILRPLEFPNDRSVFYSIRNFQ